MASDALLLTSVPVARNVAPMDGDAFLKELDQAVTERLAHIGKVSSSAEPSGDWTVARLLSLALKKELEAAEEAALFMAREGDVEVKLALARQCGDEAKHYRLIEGRLRELGFEHPTNPLADGYSPMFHYLKELGSTVERVAAGQFTREALAQVHNRVFIEFCEAAGDPETARLYREIIQPDEAHHHALGRKLLLRLASGEAEQKLARAAASRTLDLAEEIQELARLKKGIACAPGC
jgi:bacterioferritin (cytochrome b1)